MTSLKLLNTLGFTVLADKSLFIPKQNIIFLGLNINSKYMKISLTDQRSEALWVSCQTLLNSPNQVIRSMASGIVHITSQQPGIKYGGFHYKYLKRDKVNTAKKSKGSFDTKMVFS